MQSVTLQLPGSQLRMRTAPGLDPLTVTDEALSEAPIILSYRSGGLQKIFDAAQLRAIFGERAEEVKRAIVSLDATTLQGALSETASAPLSKEARELRAKIEAQVLEQLFEESDGNAVWGMIAALSLLLLEARLSAIVAKASDCATKARPAR